jgi:hypothetical protein
MPGILVIFLSNLGVSFTIAYLCAIFPVNTLIDSGVSYTECTVVGAADGKPWCSTLTDIEGKHVGGQGNWGHCPYQGCQPGLKNRYNGQFIS